MKDDFHFLPMNLCIYSSEHTAFSSKWKHKYDLKIHLLKLAYLMKAMKGSLMIRN